MEAAKKVILENEREKKNRILKEKKMQDEENAAIAERNRLQDIKDKQRADEWAAREQRI